jgi:hypothetical protein
VGEAFEVEVLPDKVIQSKIFKRWLKETIDELKKTHDEFNGMLDDKSHPRMQGFGSLLIAAERNSITNIRNAMIQGYNNVLAEDKKNNE